MTDVLFEELKPVLNYFPIKVGKAEVRYNIAYNVYKLLYDDLQWFTFDATNFKEIKEQFLEINLAEGVVATTGLGLGVIQTILSSKENVKEVIVFEKNEEIIRMFEIFVEKSNFDSSKIKIINDDAINVVNVDCDWLVLDHFECTHQTFWEIIDQVREIDRLSECKKLLFWPMIHIFQNFCKIKKVPLNNKSYQVFRELIKFRNLPETIDQKYFPYFEKVFGYK